MVYKNIKSGVKVKMQLFVEDELWEKFKKLTVGTVTLHDHLIKLIKREVDDNKELLIKLESLEEELKR